MPLQERLHNELKTSMKVQDELKLRVLRLLLTALKKKEKEVRRPLEEGEILQTVSQQIKQRKESIAQYRKGNREDLAKNEENELRILEAFMPQQLTENELEQLVSQVIDETGAKSPKDIGKVMKTIMPRVAGRADGKVINQMVRSRLSSAL